QRRTKTTEIVEDPVEIEKTEQPALASEPAQRVKEHYSLEELTQMPREELQALQERGLDGSPADGYTVRPPHESVQGFQQSLPAEWGYSRAHASTDPPQDGDFPYTTDTHTTT